MGGKESKFKEQVHLLYVSNFIEMFRVFNISENNLVSRTSRCENITFLISYIQILNYVHMLASVIWVDTISLIALLFCYKLIKHVNNH